MCIKVNVGEDWIKLIMTAIGKAQLVRCPLSLLNGRCSWHLTTDNSGDSTGRQHATCSLLFQSLTAADVAAISPLTIQRMKKRRYSSPHFNGKRFVNPNGPAGRGLFHFLRWAASSQRKRWPKRIENHEKNGQPVQVSGDQVAATFIGHSTFLLRIGGLSILTDPIFSERSSPVSWAGPRRVRPPGLPFEELPRIDLVLVSHNHYDHMDAPTLRRLRREFDPFFVTGLGNVRWLRRLAGIEKAMELDWWGTHRFRDEIKITMTPSQHFSSRSMLDRDRTLWGGFLIEAGGRRVYFTGDSGYAGHFKEIAKKAGPIDLALIPIGSYEPRWFMKLAHVNPDEAVQIHLDLNPRQSVGMHFGTFQLTDESIDAPLHDLRDALKRRGVNEEQFRVLAFGETLVVP